MTKRTTTWAMIACLVMLSGCGGMAKVGSAGARLGVPIDVAGHVTKSGGEGEVVSKATGQPLVSAAFAIYWPAVFAEVIAWVQSAAPELATMVLGKPAVVTP